MSNATQHTDLSEKEFETKIVNFLVNNNGYEQGVTSDYDTTFAVDPSRIERFLRDTQLDKVTQSRIFDNEVNRNKFFKRLSDELKKKGVVHILRNGLTHINYVFDFYKPWPSELNETAKRDYKKNIFCIIRQLQYSAANHGLAIDMAIFINGLPILTIELKNTLSGQTYNNAINQYKNDRDPADPLLAPKRCAVHFALDDEECYMCTALAGKNSWFLPFNLGKDGGAGNPVNPNGERTHYMWDDIFTKRRLSQIIENFAQVVSEENPKTHRVKEKVIWPRYHQLDAVTCLVEHTQNNPLGQRYLIQHSAGSGKSNTITWLAYQLVGLLKDNQAAVDSVIVVTDRVNLDKQIKNNLRLFKRMDNTVAWAEHSSDLKKFLENGKKIIVTIIHKFPYIMEAMGGELKDKRFAVVIDEAHSSQTGNMANTMSATLSGASADDDSEDIINKQMESRRLAKNANFYAFTATPKNKTLEMFGVKMPMLPDGKVPHEPFHIYSMKQAIEEGFILDVLKHYTPYQSFFNITKIALSDPSYDKKKAEKKLRAYVEGQRITLEQKANVIVEHFHTSTASKIGGQARAMLVTPSILRAIEYFFIISKLLKERRSPYKAVVAFSGEKEYENATYDEAKLNGFPSSQIEEKMGEEPYRILIVADKFQTGYDQPLLHTMYVDKILTDVKAVQTLSRLNRCAPKKHDTFVLDFANDPKDIKKSFDRYYKQTTLTDETDVNRLNDLIDTVESYSLYEDDVIENYVDRYLRGADREELDPVLDNVVDQFEDIPQLNDKIKCKKAIKNVIRIYPFLAAIYDSCVRWEQRYIFYCHLVHKLPSLAEEDDDLSDLLREIEFDKYRLVKYDEQSIVLEEDGEVDPITVSINGGVPNPEEDLLSVIVERFNQLHGNIDWKNDDTVRQQLAQLPERLAQDPNFANASRNSDQQNINLQGQTALMTLMVQLLSEGSQMPSLYIDNEQFRNIVNQVIIPKAQDIINGQIRPYQSNDDSSMPIAAEPMP